MSLGEYARKRTFEKTPEPPPAEVLPGGSSFCVQRHDATRLHYDFRLEIGGTLKSWAIPKGPTLDPTKKPLAMHVEDHPLDYGGFEGNIPKGNYGGGSVMLWDRGFFELLGDTTAEKQIERGDLKFRLHGEKLNGEFAIVRMKNRGKGNEWLLIKKKDAHAKADWNIEDYARSVLTGRTQEEIAKDLPAVKTSAAFDAASLPGAVKSPLPSSVAPMLATLADKPPSGADWLFEVKWDGVRGLCFLDGGQLRIFTRNGNSCEKQYPELSVLPHFVSAGTAILDGELAVLDGQGRPRFSLIQPRIMVSDPNSIAHLARSSPVTLFLFDLLYLDGYDLRAVPLDERKRALAAVLKTSERIRYSEHFSSNGSEMLEAARQMGLEGIVAKRASSKYEPRRGRDWIKIKIVNQQEFVICGLTHGERSPFSSLVLGTYNGGKLVHAGQVGTGFDQKTQDAIYARLEPLITKRSPFSTVPRILREATWVKPEIVCEVRFTEWTPDKLLRAPVFAGLRLDITPGGDAPAEPERGALLPATAKEATEVIDGHSLKFTNLGKVYYPKEGHTKRDVINFYDAVSRYILPHLKDRPLSLKRYPNGIESEFFFQKDTAEKFPSWMRVEPIYSEHRKAPIRYVISNDRATLLYLANLGCIDQNPWMSRVGSLENPDFMLIDLDPQECSYDLIIEAAQLARKKLDLLGLEGYPKTTGGDGMHIYVPLDPVYSYEQVRSFAEILSHLVVQEKPELFTTPRSVSRRKKGTVYFDYLQISSSKTIAAPYVLRAYAGAPVATPLAWSEVTAGLVPTQFSIKNALDRFARVGDLFAPVLTNHQRLEAALEKLQTLIR